MWVGRAGTAPRVPVVRALPERALYCAYRTKDLHLGGFSDKASAAR